MTSFSRVPYGRVALAATLWACACERDSTALFDNQQLPASPTGGAQAAVAGSSAMAGDGAAGDDGTGGMTGDAGGTMPVAGTGASTSGGVAAEGGTGTAGGAGKAGSATAGSGAGGTKPDPEPVTIQIDEFEDAHVASCMQYVNFGKSATLHVDYGNSCAYQALLKPSLAKVPEGALISKATLTLFCVNDGGEVGASYVRDAWEEDTVRWNNRPDVGSAFAELTCPDEGPVTLDLTAVVTAWVSGEQAAHGLYLITEAQNGSDFASSQAADADERPSLSVTYRLPAK